MTSGNFAEEMRDALYPDPRAKAFVASNESQNDYGAIGDGGYGVGRHQLDTRYGFNEFFHKDLTPYEQDNMIPKEVRGEIFHDEGRPLNATEQKAVSTFMSSQQGQHRQDSYYSSAYEVPSYLASRAHSKESDPTTGQPKYELQALMLDMFTQRGVPKMGKLLKNQGPLTAGQLVDLEIADLDGRKKPGGHATILDRRVRGATDLGVKINPAHVIKTITDVIGSPKFNKMTDNKQKTTLAMLRRTLKLTMEQYPQTLRGHTRTLTVLQDRLKVKPSVKAIQEAAGGGMDESTRLEMFLQGLPQVPRKP